MRGRLIPCLCLALAVLAGRANAQAGRPDTAQTLRDRADIQELIVRYGTALDTRDPDAYAGVFTEDATLDVAGQVRKGRQQIRQIIVGLQDARSAGRASGTPAAALYHVISNTSITIVSATEARHHSYWQTVRVGPNNQITVGAIGKYEDVLVKRDGRWLIQSRTITPFTN